MKLLNARLSPIIFTGMLFFSCNLFSARDPEYPDPIQEQIPDYLNFRGVLSTTWAQFRSVDFEDLFNDSLLYIDATGTTFQKKEVIGRLDEIVADIRQGAISVNVRWDTLSGSEEPKIFDEDRRITIYRHYIDTLWYFPAATDSLSSGEYEAIVKIHEGTARFDLSYARVRNMWTIILWKDVPDNVPRSIYHPGYVE